ncbi:DUF429 domain-containing protein [Pseudokineococcus basanitobsidens]|uniref:DUF429 domain-containing protein n=1 Tax=Pseudokineococcus basanitobsidens TaxID=1926649 RepID=A0ABU8RJK0_9ACTN
MTVVMGVDGARGAWAACTWAGPGEPPVLAVLADPEAVLVAARAAGAATVGLDLPLGLAARGHRGADVAARAHLVAAARRSPAQDARAAGSRLFMTPVREVVEAGGTYADARALARRLGSPTPSAQAFALLGHVRRWDAHLPRWSGPDAPVLVEVHPELSFTRAAGPVPAPKRSARGACQRLDVLAGPTGLACGRRALDDALLAAPTDLALDDALDAAAAAWTAWRVAADDPDVLRLPEHEERDGDRLVRILV